MFTAEFTTELSTEAQEAKPAKLFHKSWSADVSRVRSFWRNVERFAPGANLVSRLRSGSKQVIVLSGWACDMWILPDGRRQIFSFFIPGDHIEIRENSGTAARSFVALTRLEVIDRRRLAADGAEPHMLPQAPSFEESEDRHFVQMVRLGQLTGKERMLHLFLELYDRLAAVGLTKDASFRFPLTQEVLADALGLSIVHVNRTLQQLRREGLVELKSGTVTLLQRAQLSALALYRGASTGPAATSFLKAPASPKYA
jgi:CRP-like cAMP-binding protein